MRNRSLFYLSVFVVALCFLLAGSQPLRAAGNATLTEKGKKELEDPKLRDQAIKVFLDVERRFQNYLRTEITFVNYVRDRTQADVYIMQSSQHTGSNGREYTITLIGQKKFENENDTLKFVSYQTDTEDMRRRGVARTIKMGLMRYVAKTPLANYIRIDYQKRINPTAVTDRWNNWVFHFNFSGNFDGQESTNRFGVRGSFSADKVTPDIKLSFNIRSEYNESNYKTSSGTVSSIVRSQSFRGLAVKSLSDHWSMGVFGSANSSIYDNIKRAGSIAPAIEFNLFPYEDYAYRELRFLYRIGYTNVTYNEITIFDKTKEELFNQSLSATLELKQRWGSVRSSLTGSHYLHDFSKNRLDLSTRLSLRLFEGLSMWMEGKVSMLRDQLSLPARDASEEDILLRRRQLATNYRYGGRVGFTVSFGSIYSNVVNPRFGG